MATGAALASSVNLLESLVVFRETCSPGFSQQGWSKIEKCSKLSSISREVNKRRLTLSCLNSSSSDGKERTGQFPTLHSSHFSRRNASLSLVLFSSTCLLETEPAFARDKRFRKDISLDDYQTTPSGVKFYDVSIGKGELAEKGKFVSVHFDCVWKTLTVISSRESKLLGGNRVIAQPYDFVIGAKPGAERKRDPVDSANGLFSAQASPKPPKILYSITEGMRVGGKRKVFVTPDVGYGDKGFAEVPPGASFELDIELLEIKPTPA